MAWYKVDDKLHSHPKARRAGLAAMGLWTLAGSHCMDYLTDGIVENWFVESWPDGPNLAARLVAVGMWDTHQDGFEFHDWEKYQPTADAVRETRNARAEAGKKGAEKRWADKPVANGMANAIAKQWPADAPSPVPVPSPVTSKTSKSQSRNERAKNETDAYSSPVIEGMGNRAGIIDAPALVAEVKSRTNRDVPADRLPALVNHFVGKSKKPVKAAQAYMVTCLRISAAEVQQFIDENGLAS